MSILSDITKRILILKGEEEVKRILNLTKPEDFHSVKVDKIGEDIWQIELIYRVGSYYRK